MNYEVLKEAPTHGEREREKGREGKMRGKERRKGRKGKRRGKEEGIPVI